MDLTTDSGGGSESSKGISCELNLSIRARKAVMTLGCLTINDILNKSASDFKKLKNCGAKTIAEIREKLADRGFILPD